MATYTAQQILSANSQGLNLGAAAILDSSANVLADLDQLEPIAAAGKIGSVTFTDSAALTISLTGTQAAADLDVVKLFQGSYSLSVSFATVAQAEQIAAALPHVPISISDNAELIAASLDQLQSIAGSLTAINVNPTNPAAPSVSQITLTQAQLTADSAAVAQLVSPQGGHLGTDGVVLTVSNTLSITQAASDEALNGYITGLTVIDSLANVEATLTTLVTRPNVTEILYPYPAPATYQFSSITLADSGTPIVVVPYNNGNDQTPSLQDVEGFLAAITNQHSVEWTGVSVDGVSALLDSQTFTPSKSGTLVAIEVAVQDTAAHVSAAIDYLENYDLAGKIVSISITDGVVPTFTAAQLTVDASVIAKIALADLTAATAIADAADLQAIHGVSVQDNAADVSASLDGLQGLAAAGKLISIALIDSTIIPTVAITTAQAAADTAALGTISGKFTVVETASGTSESIVGVQNAVGNTVVFSDTASSYTLTPDGNGTGFTVTEGSMTDHLSGIQALQFGDVTEIVASQTHVAGAVSSAQITTLYAAVFARQPDIPGLGFYETYEAANPSVNVITYSEYFLSSPEYTSNTAHVYAQTTAGETQFITDTYNNLLARGPEAGAVAFYLNVINPMLANLTPGTAAYTQADLVAHATVIAYFSQSPEFLGDVTITAQNPASAQHWLQLI